MGTLIYWWQHLPENISPVLFELGSIQIRYYGLMYVLSIVVVYVLTLSRLKKEKLPYKAELIDGLFTWIILGTIIGARLGYVLFYDLLYFVEHPQQILLPFSFSDGVRFTGISGLSYHGGLIGVVGALLIFCRLKKVGFWALADFVIPAVPLGYTLGRIGNFLNGELYGRLTEVSWGMYFPSAQTYQLRHPSQLYEAFFEGIFLFVILWSLRQKRFFDGFLISLYIMGYGVVRFFIEFFREPDAHLGFILFSLSMGQLLCLAMIGVATMLLVYNAKRH